jgi:hypothetical protein
MPTINMKHLTETLDISAIEQVARADWQRSVSKRRRLEHTLIRLLPWGLVVMVVIFYGLSAPHTAHLLSMITPTFVGQYLAPIGWELGVLIVAALREAGWRNWLTSTIMWTLLLLSIVINIAGGFIAVVTAATDIQLAQDTALQLLARFGDLPATYQVVLLLVPFVGGVIPIIAKLAGEGVVKLALGSIRLERESDDELWARESAKVMHGALLQAALKAGAGVKTAGNFATGVVEQMYRLAPVQTDARGRQRLMTNVSNATAHAEWGFAGLSQDSLRSPAPDESPGGQSQILTQDSETGQSVPRLSKHEVLAWLKSRDDIAELDNRAACRVYTLETYGEASDTGYKTFERARQEMGK